MIKISVIFTGLVFCSNSYSQFVDDTLNVSLNRYSDTLQDNNKLFIDFFLFSPSNETRFNIPVKGVSKFSIVDSNGVLVATLFDKELERGQYRLFWNFMLKSGVYNLKLSVSVFSDEKKYYFIK